MALGSRISGSFTGETANGTKIKGVLFHYNSMRADCSWDSAPCMGRAGAGQWISDVLGIAQVDDASSGAPLGYYIIDTTVPGAVLVDPKSTPDQLASSRLKVTTNGSIPQANYVIRNVTSGGGVPKKCDAPPGELYPVPFTSTNTFYLCQ